MPGLAQWFQDDSSSDGSISDASFDLGAPPPLIQWSWDIFDSSDDNLSYSDDSATMPLSVSTPSSGSSICSSLLRDNMSYLTASDYESQQGINDDDDGEGGGVSLRGPRVYPERRWDWGMGKKKTLDNNAALQV